MPKSNSHLIRGLGLACLALASATCNGSPNQPSSAQVEILHWWTAGGEAEALSRLLTLFRDKHPNRKVIDAGVDGSETLRATIKSQMREGQPPDTFQANGGWDLMAWVLYNNRNADDSKMEAIDEYSQDWRDAIPAPVLATVSYKDRIYAVPLNIHRLNTLYFNKKVFEQYGVPFPTRATGLDDLFAIADVFKAQGITPIALGTNRTWTLALLLFENILVARAGATYYEEFFLTPRDAFEPEIKSALEDFRTLLSYTTKPEDAGKLTWDGAINDVLNEKAAMTIMGDWAKGYFLSHGKTEDEFGEIPMPGTAGTFVFTTDTFGLPIGAPNRPGALEMLQVFASNEGQDIFNPTKGSISARKDLDTSKYDQMAQQTIDDFQHASSIVPATAILAPQEYIQAISDALAEFARDGSNGNASNVLHTLDNWSDVLRLSPWP